MNLHDSTYLNLCHDVAKYGRPSDDRTGTGTRKRTGLTARFPMSAGFPLLTTKFVSMKAIELELRMFLKGITDNDFLASEGINIWTPFANEDGYLGPIYGAMWRRWPGQGEAHFSAAQGGWVHYETVDQIDELMRGLVEKPTSRRHVVSGWNPALLPIEGQSHAENVNAELQALPPCHALWQVHLSPLTIAERWAKLPSGLLLPAVVRNEEEDHKFCDAHGIPRYVADLSLYQRSADMFLGVPFNIASYSLLLHYICHSLNFEPGDFIWMGGDCHIYNNHVDQVNEQYSRMQAAPASPQIVMKNRRFDLWDYTADDFEIVGYNHMGKIAGQMSV